MAGSARSAIIIDAPFGQRRPTGVELADAPEEGADPGPFTVTVGGEGEADAPARRAPVRDFDRNLAEDVPAGALDVIAEMLLEGVQADRDSRGEWEDTANRAADYLGIKLQDPTTSVSADGTVCKTIATVLLEAATKLWGNARSELLPADGPVKTRRLETNIGLTPAAPPPPPPAPPQGAPPQGAQGGIAGPPAPNQPPAPTPDELAQAREADMNWYLTTKDREYYPDTSRMLFSRALIGVAFKKVYRCPLKRRPVSVWVKAQDLIVSNDCAHLSGAGRITERIRMRQSVMKRMQKVGAYRDISLVQPTGQATETEIAIGETEGVAPMPQRQEDYEHLVYEVYCELGSDDDEILGRDEHGREPGYPLPYRVAIDVDSRAILEIRRNWREGDEDYTPRRRYVKFGFVPGLGFYDYGLIHLLGNQTLAATMIERASVDSSLFANFPGGVFLKGPGSRQQDTVVRPQPGQFIGMDAAGAQRIQDVILPNPYKPPSPEVIALGQKIEGDARRLAGVIEIPVGEGRVGNTPVGTIMSYVESISMVPGAIHKDDHSAQAEEFDLLRELLAEEPQVLWRGNRSPARRWQLAEELMDPDIIPAADPNTPSQIHRLTKLQALVSLSGLPQFQGICNPRTIYERTVEALAGENAAEFTLPPAPPAPPAPPPQVVVAQIKAQSDQQRLQAEQNKDAMDHQFRMSELQQRGVQQEADRESAEIRAAMGVEAANVKVHHDTHMAMQQAQQPKPPEGPRQPPLTPPLSPPLTA